MATRLKLRVRSCDGQRRGKIDLTGDSSLIDVKAAVAFNLGLTSADGLQLSLDKKALLHDSKTVASQGVCSGDLLWVHGISSGQPQSPTVAIEAQPAALVSTASISTEPPRKENDIAKRIKLGSASNPNIRAASEIRIPAAAMQGRPQQIKAAMVAILLDANLQLSSGQDEKQVAFGKCRKFAVELSQPQGVTEGNGACSATVTISHTTGNAIVCGAVQPTGSVYTVSPKWDTIQMTHIQTTAARSDREALAPIQSRSAATEPESYFGQSGFDSNQAAAEGVMLESIISNSQDLVREVKDHIAAPLVRDLCEAQGLQPPPSLTTLPNELLLKCLGYLQAEDVARLSCVNKHLKESASVDELWRPLFNQSFDESFPVESLAGKNCWKALYSNHKKQERQRDTARRPSMPTRQGPRVGRPHLFVPPPSIPGIIGGDMDRLPFLGGRPRHPFLHGSASGFRQH